MFDAAVAFLRKNDLALAYFFFFFLRKFSLFFLLLVRGGGGRGRDGQPSDVWLVVVLHGYGALPNGLSLKRRPEIEMSGWP